MEVEQTFPPTGSEPSALVKLLAVHRSFLGYKEDMLLSSLDCLECNTWNIQCVTCWFCIILCCNLPLFSPLQANCVPAYSTYCFSGRSSRGRTWFGHDNLWGELSAEATEEGVADGMGLLVTVADWYSSHTSVLVVSDVQ